MEELTKEAILAMTDEEFARHLEALRDEGRRARARAQFHRQQSIEAEKRWRAAREEFRARFGY